MHKYGIFREILDFVAKHAEVIDADMSNYCGNIEVVGEDNEHTIKIEISIKEKEANKDD